MWVAVLPRRLSFTFLSTSPELGRTTTESCPARSVSEAPVRGITSNEAAVVDKDGHRQREDELRPRHIHHYIDKNFLNVPGVPEAPKSAKM